jgi:ribosome-associated toxin RatA of RatAB toxin-antitoxin module
LGKYKFSIDLDASPSQLVNLATDYEHLPNYIPNQLKNVTIIEVNNNETITEEELFFITFFKKKIEQKTIHKKISDNKLSSQIISGPAKGTLITVLYEKINSGTRVSAEIDLNLSLKFKIMQPVITKSYKTLLTTILWRMNTKIMESNI